MGRNFYSDDQGVTPVPGTVIAATDAQIESLGPNKLVNGSSIRSPSFIEAPLASIRTTLNSWINITETKIDTLTTNFHTQEQHFASTTANLYNHEEDLLTSGVYILIAGFTGTIITRRSNLFLKGVVPTALAFITFKLTLPKTFSNTADYTYKLEQANAPGLVKGQDKLVSNVNALINQTEIQTKQVETAATSKYQSLKNSFKKFTGLKIDDDVTK